MPSSRTRRKKPISGNLKGFTQARKSKIDLLRDIQTHVVAENARSGNDHREKTKIHVSEIVKGACPRMLFYKVSGEEPTDAVPGAFHQLVSIWAAGSAEHEKWQRWLREMGDLWGTWFCLQCGNSWEDLSPQACGLCDSGLLRYDEVSLEIEDFALVGHADGAVPRLDTLVEIKTFAAGSVRVEDPKRVAEHTHKVDGRSLIDHDALWKSLKRPLKSHIVQGMFYLWMSEQMGLPYKKIIFIYESKTTQATKSFEVTLIPRVIQPYIDTLTEVMEAVENEQAPERPALYTKDAKPCSACPFRTTCWGETNDEDATSTSVSAGRPRTRSEEDGGEAEVRPASKAGERAAGRARRRNGSGRPGPGRDDDGLHPVGRASRRSVGDGRGGREVRRSRDGEAPRPRFARRDRQGRDED